MINSIIGFSIRNKALIWLMTLGLIIGGIYSMTKIPLDAVPDITNNQVMVITTAPNLGTEDIERFVTYQVELAVANLPQVEEIRSVSRFGLSVVTIVFEDDAGTFLPRQLVSEALAEVKERIPKGMGEPFMAPISTGLGEIYQYVLEVDPEYKDRYDDMELRTIQDWIVKRQMAMLPGVVEVNSFGGRVKQYEVSLDPDKLRSMGITISEVFNALEKNNQNTGGAYIEKNHQANFIRGEGLMRSIDDIKNTYVKSIAGQPIYVRDVAEVNFGSFVRYGAFTRNGEGETVGGIVMMLKGENSNEVIKRVKERVELIQKSLPEGVHIKAFLDRSKLIKSTTSTVAENLALGALIVIFVLVIFLGNLRGGLIVASTIPLALLFAFIMMYLTGVWANLMSLGALDFGILIDGAVIIVESMIFYLHAKGMIGTKPSQEEKDKIAFKASSKMMNSAFFGQLIILIVFIPLVALQGVEGKMFKPMALTFGYAVLGVMLLSLTYIPMMSATFLNPPKTDKLSWGSRAIRALENIYKPLLNGALKHGRAVVISALILLAFSGFLFNRMGAEFMPKLDEGDFAFQAFLKPGTSLSEVRESSIRIESIVMENFPDEVESIQARIGVATLPMDPMPMDIADIFVILKPKDQWKKVETKAELIEKVREAVSVLPGINYEFTQPIEMRFNELLTGIREDVAIKLYGDNLDILAEKAQEIASLISGIRGVEGVNAEAAQGLPQMTIVYDRNKLGFYGLEISDLNELIETAFSGGVAGNIYEGERLFDLVVRLDKEHRKSIDNIRNLYVNLPDGGQIPLKEVADINYQPGPMQISRDNTNRRTYVGVNVGDRDVKSLVEEIQQVLDKKLKLPSGYYIRYGGAFENLERATKRLSIVVPLALALIFILVFFAVKSFKQTLMIYMAIPFAAVGGILSLWLRDMPFSISAGVGFIVLFGVAVLNGLVMISGFNELKSEGKLKLNELIQKGAVRRIRPILLTASTDILGFLPMAISTSAGAEVQRPLATVVIGGMITSTILTLFVLPVLYRWVEQKNFKNTGFKTAPVLASLFFVFLSVNLFGQTETFTQKQAIEQALNNYPTIKVAALEVERRKSLKSTAYDFGTTSVFTGKEEVGNGNAGIYNVVGFSQNNIDLIGMFSKSKLGNMSMQEAEASKELTEKMLVRDVSIAWNIALIYKQQKELYAQLDSIYSDFFKMAKLRYETEESSRLEFLSASSKYQETRVNLKMAESKYYSGLDLLNQYLMLDGEFDIADDISEINLYVPLQEDSLQSSPELNLYETKILLAECQWKAEKSSLYPKFDVSYTLQNVNNVAGYNAWQVGVSMPLVFFSQSGKNKAAKINYEISREQFTQKRLELNAQFKQLLNRYNALASVISYYEKEAIPLADEQIKASNLAYKLGDIDYVQFIQNLETSIKIKLDFLKQKAEYLQLSAQLNYLTGK